MTLGKKNVRAAYPKEMLKFFRARLMYVGCSCTKVLCQLFYGFIPNVSVAYAHFFGSNFDY